MKVLAVGGCGGMGRVAVKALEVQKYCEEIVVADINGENARKFADECGPSVSWMQVDISDGDSLKNIRMWRPVQLLAFRLNWLRMMSWSG